MNVTHPATRLQVGARPDSQRYVSMKLKRAKECGFKSLHKVGTSAWAPVARLITCTPRPRTWMRTCRRRSW